MTRAPVRMVGVLLGAAALGLAPVGARQPPRVEPVGSSVVLDIKQGGIADCAGLAFLPDGVRVVARWERRSFGLRIPDGQLIVVGRRGELSAPVAVSAVDVPFDRPGTRVAVTRAGDVLTAGGWDHLLLQPVGPGPTLPPGKRIDLTDVPRWSPEPTRLWVAGPAGDVYLLRAGTKSAYQLAAVEGAPLTEGKGRVKVLAEGGKQDVRWAGGDHVQAADLHPSGGWFAAALYSPSAPKDVRLDLWELGPVPKKQSVPLKVDATAVSFAPDGKAVALGLSDGTVAFLATADLAARREPVEIGTNTVAALAHHPRGPYLACGTYASRGADNLFVVRTDTGAVVRRIPADPHGILAVRFNATGTRVATFGGSGRVAVWDTTDLAGPVE